MIVQLNPHPFPTYGHMVTVSSACRPHSSSQTHRRRSTCRFNCRQTGVSSANQVLSSHFLFPFKGQTAAEFDIIPQLRFPVNPPSDIMISTQRPSDHLCCSIFKLCWLAFTNANAPTHGIKRCSLLQWAFVMWNQLWAVLQNVSACVDDNLES